MLKQGSQSEVVKTLQMDLHRLGVADLVIDGCFGPKTRDAVIDAQYWLMIEPDGRVGPVTEAAMKDALAVGWKLGDLRVLNTDRGELRIFGGKHPDRWIPNPYGWASWYGGPDDKGDRIYGQACLPGIDTMAKAREKYPELFDYNPPLFRDVVDPLPEGMGLSWATNPDSYGCACRWSNPKPDPRKDRVIAELDGVIVVMAPMDFGPAKRLRRAVDLFRQPYLDLGCGTDRHRVHVGFAADQTPIGVYKVLDG